MRNTSQAIGKPRKNRNDRLELRLVDEEKRAFREAADLAGVPLSSWVRERLRQAARKELEEYGRAVPFLSGAGSKQTQGD